MDAKDHKTKIILNEIRFWKQNKMLPEHYCDYLLALYNQGDELEESQSVTSKFSFMALISGALIFALIPFSLFVIYFTELSFVLQTAILAGFVVLLTFTGIYYSNKEMFSPLIYITTSLIFLIYSINLVDVFFQGDKFITYLILFFNCIIWISAGRYLKLLYFTIGGTVGIILLIISILI
ncbi:MAG: hypothetical protein ACQEUT_04480 [Bacillota bacterium]